MSVKRALISVSDKTDVVEFARKLSELGIEIVTAAAENTAAVQQAAQSLAGRVDALYATTDNTVASALEAVVDVSMEIDVPFLMADPTSISKGPTVCAGWDYYSHGRLVGDVVLQILRGSAPADIPITYQKDTIHNQREVILNMDTAGMSGVALPQGVIDEATSIYYGGYVWAK